MIKIIFIPQLHGSLHIKYNSKNPMHKKIVDCQDKIYNIILSKYIKQGIKINLYSEDSLFKWQKKSPKLEDYEIETDSIPQSLFNYGASKLLKYDYPDMINLIPIMDNSTGSLRSRGHSLIKKTSTRKIRKELHNIIYQNRETEVLSHIYRNQQTNPVKTNILIFGAAHNFLDYNKLVGINTLFKIELIESRYFKRLLNQFKRYKSKITKTRRV